MTRFDDNEPITTDRGIITNENALEFTGSYVDRLIADGPLVDESGRPLTTETFRERFTRDFNFEVNDAVGLIFLAVPILMLCLISFLAGDVR